MDNSLTHIASLVESGYKLALYRNPLGECWAELHRGWIARRRVRIDLDGNEFERAKEMMGAKRAKGRFRT